MPEQHIAADRRRRERWLVAASAITLVILRSALFVVRPESYFDSDQAIFGLMAKHLAELRAFPLFMYGQSYLLGVEAWMAAPLFALFGASAALLKLPLLAVNAAIAWLLLRTLERDAGLRPVSAAVAALPFLIPAVALAAMYVEPSGGNVEPYLYVLLIWALRNRPIAAGLVLALGFLQREFTLYGMLALLVIDLWDRELFTPPTLRRRAVTLAVAAAAWIAVQGLRPFSSGSGPGTSIDHLYGAPNNILELASRTCIAPASITTGVSRLISLHWPALLGTAPYPLVRFAIESGVSQGLAGASWLPPVFVLLSLAGMALGLRAAPVPRVALYLIAVGVLSAAGYVGGRCGEVTFTGMRYELLSILGLIGLAAAFLAAHPPRMLTLAWGAVLAAWIVILAVPHVRLTHEYATHPPVPAKRQLIQVLEARGIRYATADYWIAYYVTFMTRERIIIAAERVERIRTYNAVVAAHAAETIHLSRRACPGGAALIPGVYQCP